MPFGLCNAPVTFQHLMQNCLGELNLTYALIYLDDIVVFSDTEKEHIKHLAVVFERFWEHGLKLKPSKCHFFWKEINYLGHHVSTEGMKPGMDNMEGITEMVPPQDSDGNPSVLGCHQVLLKVYQRLCQHCPASKRSDFR